MVSRTDREQLISIIERYIHEDITAFNFDEQIADIRARTEDKSVAELIWILWFFYDDITDHKIVIGKPGWDLFQRILLFLRTDLELASLEAKPWRWHWGLCQALACCGVTTFLGAWARLGWGEQLLPVAWGLGLVGVGLIQLDKWRKGPPLANDLSTVTYPFDSLAQIRGILKQKAGHIKTRYPKSLEFSRIRADWVGYIMIIVGYIGIFTLAPAIMLYMCLPQKVLLPERLHGI